MFDRDCKFADITDFTSEYKVDLTDAILDIKVTDKKNSVLVAKDEEIKSLKEEIKNLKGDLRFLDRDYVLGLEINNRRLLEQLGRENEK